MTTIILVSATSFEIEPTLRFLKTFNAINTTIIPCITGVGMVNTAFELGRLNGQTIDMAINAGIAGSFGSLKKGDVVNVTQDRFSELGAEDGSEFLSIDALGFGQQAVAPQRLIANAVTNQLVKANGITVNTVHGNDESIKKITALYQPDVETMEGAAFMHAANAFGWQAIQLRAISNAVEKRDKQNWDIALAIKNLNIVVIDLLKILDEH
jgi:futalosine hydrolase